MDFEALLDLDFGPILRSLLGTGPGVEIIIDVVSILTVSTFCLLIVILLIWLERKVIARFQDRIGPNRVGGRFGLGQTVADVLKLLTKEFVTPSGADWMAYNLAPFLIVMTALMMWAVMPFTAFMVGVDLNIGLFYILSISSVSVVCLLLAGWGSNNKYALLGAFRSVAQLVSYEVPMVISLLVPILLARSMSLNTIAESQNVWFLLMVPLSALIFFISALAETGRTPFDLLEAESEIVAGFHVEYGGMKFGMFFLAEFVSTLFMAALFSTIYLGGYRFVLLELFTPFETPALLALVVFFVKTFLIYFLFIWMRATFPRVRIDQMLNFNWKFLVPVVLVLILATAVLDGFFVTPDGTLTGGQEVARFFVHLASNILIGVGALVFARRSATGRGIEEQIVAPVVTAAGALVEGADPHGGHDDHGHGHDDHAHGHDDHGHAKPVPAHD
ncbi:MAG: NADH-quinone oxidoreductase subunit NuoH [Chloroflexota bacterium]